MATDTLVRPGDPWYDNRGKEIQAHGGSILQVGKTYYWFGEDRDAENNPKTPMVACYSSTDLVHWTYRNESLTLDDPEHLGYTPILQRPKVFYNKKTRKYVMYIHYDSPGKGYLLARVGVAISDTVEGPYKFLRSFRPLGQESRDIGQFIDDDGLAYLIFESRPTRGFFIAKLSDNYLSVEKEIAFIHAPLEGGTVVHYKGLYYVIGSHLTGWGANPNVYASAPNLAGPWTEMKNIAPPETKTYESQSSLLMKIVGTKTTSVIYMGDRWFPDKLWDSRNIWMPLQIGDGNLRLPEPQPWTINLKTGETQIMPDAPSTAGRQSVSALAK
jgi:beta-xylosidase